MSFLIFQCVTFLWEEEKRLGDGREKGSGQPVTDARREGKKMSAYVFLYLLLVFRILQERAEEVSLINNDDD